MKATTTAAKNIATTEKLYLSDIISKEVTVVAASGTVNAKKGHLVFMNEANGKYVANAVATSLIPTDIDTVTNKYPGAVAVLLEDADLTTSDSKVPAILSGTVFYEMIRKSGITAEACPDWVLDMYSAKQTAIKFIGYEEE